MNERKTFIPEPTVHYSAGMFSAAAMVAFDEYLDASYAAEIEASERRIKWAREYLDGVVDL